MMTDDEGLRMTYAVALMTLCQKAGGMLRVDMMRPDPDVVLRIEFLPPDPNTPGVSSVLFTTMTVEDSTAEANQSMH